MTTVFLPLDEATTMLLGYGVSRREGLELSVSRCDDAALLVRVSAQSKRVEVLDDDGVHLELLEGETWPIGAVVDVLVTDRGGRRLCVARSSVCAQLE